MKRFVSIFFFSVLIISVCVVPAFASSFTRQINLPNGCEYYYICKNEDLQPAKDIEGCEYVVYCTPEKLVSQYGTQFTESWMNGEDAKMPVHMYCFESMEEIDTWILSPSAITPLYYEERVNAYIKKDSLIYTNHGENYEWGSNQLLDMTGKDYPLESFVSWKYTSHAIDEVLGVFPVCLMLFVSCLGIRKGISLLTGVLRDA